MDVDTVVGLLERMPAETNDRIIEAHLKVAMREALSMLTRPSSTRSPGARSRVVVQRGSC
jgi:hypothetical protein